MAISVNNPQQTDAGSGTTGTHSSYAVGAESNRILVVHVSWFEDGADRTVDTVVFNTTEGLTQSANISDEYDNYYFGSEIWYRLAPSNATADIVVTMNTATDAIIIQAYYLDDAIQQAPEATGSFGAENNADPQIVSITTVTSNAMVCVGINTEPDTSMTDIVPESGTTEDLEIEWDASFDDTSGMGHETVVSAGGETHGWSLTGDNTASIAVLTSAAFAVITALAFTQASFRAQRAGDI